MSLQIRMSGLLVGYSTRSSYDVLNRQIQITPDVSLSEPPIGFSYTSTGQRASMIDSTATTTDDAHDRLISKSTPQGTLSYGYDLAGNLISTQSNHANGMTIIYTYDGDGNRVAQTTGGITTTFLVDEINPTGYAQVVEELVGGTVQRTYTYGLDLISQNRWNGSAWIPSYHLVDGLRSVRTLTDVNGSATDSYTYDAFGSQIAASGSTSNRYGFTGEQFDDDLGLYYLRARYYNQSNGRFLSRDTYPLNQIRPREWNRYSYVAGDPVNAVDPSGKTLSSRAISQSRVLIPSMPAISSVGIRVIIIVAVVGFVLYAKGKPKKEKSGYAHSQEANQIRSAARNCGIDPRDFREFGDFVEEMKPYYEKRGVDTLTYKILLEIGKLFKEENGGGC